MARPAPRLTCLLRIGTLSEDGRGAGNQVGSGEIGSPSGDRSVGGCVSRSAVATGPIRSTRAVRWTLPGATLRCEGELRYRRHNLNFHLPGRVDCGTCDLNLPRSPTGPTAESARLSLLPSAAPAGLRRRAAHLDRESVIVGAGLEAGELAVTSPLDMPSDGMWIAFGRCGSGLPGRRATAALPGIL